MMFRQTTYRCLATVLAAAGLLGEVRAQLDQFVPPGTPGAEDAIESVNGLAAGIPDCSCSCCQVTSRSSSQQVGGVDLACTTDGIQNPDNQCPMQCASNAFSDVVNSGDGKLQYSLFCHMTCLPAREEIGSTCRSLTQEEHAELLTQGGNGQDPATLFAPKAPPAPEELVDPDAPPEPPQLADQEAMNDANNAASGKAAGAVVKDDAAEKKEKDSGAMVAEASGKQAMAASMEARLTEAEAVSAQSLSQANGDMESAKSDSLIVTAAKAQVQAAEVRAAIYAKSAAKAAARAEAELKEIRDIPRKAAELAAAEAKKEVQAEVDEAASNVAIVKARLAPPGLPVPLAEAAVRAAQPYYAVMNKAIAMGNLYEASAHTLQDQAQSLQEQSRTVASQAVLYQSAGNGDMAKKLMAQARGMLSEATAKDAQARKDFDVAEGVRKNVPNYQANAALASARATSIANPGGQPPPAMAPTFLQQSSVKLHQSLRA